MGLLQSWTTVYSKCLISNVRDPDQTREMQVLVCRCIGRRHTLIYGMNRIRIGRKTASTLESAAPKRENWTMPSRRIVRRFRLTPSV